jgi:hypothetical protein
MTKTYEIHPLAELFPALEGHALHSFAEDIRERGQQDPAWLYEGKILDGRNRYKVCQVIGCELKTRNYDGDDPIGFVLSANLHRRHLNENQRAMVGAEIAKLTPGANQYTKGISAEKAAKLLNVGTASIERARKVLSSGDPKLVAQVKGGDKSVTAAANEAAKAQMGASPSNQTAARPPKEKKPKPRSDKIDGLVDSLVDELKAWKEENAESAITATANLVDRLKAADLIEEKKRKKAA